MKKSVLLGIPVLLLAGLVLAQRQREGNIAVLVARYPQSPALTQVVQAHLHHQLPFSSPITFPNSRNSKPVLYTTWFLGRPGVNMWLQTDSGGHVLQSRDVFNWANQAAQGVTLPASKLAALQSAMKTLPDNEPPAQVGDLLFVTFQVKGQWVNRIYDRSHLPQQVEKLYKITGFAPSK